MFTPKNNCSVLLHLECKRLLRRFLQVQLFPESLETPVKSVSKQTRKAAVDVKCVALLLKSWTDFFETDWDLHSVEKNVGIQKDAMFQQGWPLPSYKWSYGPL